jgi:hypothetical protein
VDEFKWILASIEDNTGMVVEIFVETENCLDFSMPKILIDMKK